jgi:Domain of unknown function (DUF4296)
MKVAITLLFTCLVIYSCKIKSRPAQILEKEKMGQVLWDLIKADEYISSKLINDSLKNEVRDRTIAYQQIFLYHKTNKVIFQKSYNYYMSHPAEAKVIFDTISARATRKLAPTLPGQQPKLINKP